METLKARDTAECYVCKKQAIPLDVSRGMLQGVTCIAPKCKSKAVSYSEARSRSGSWIRRFECTVCGVNWTFRSQLERWSGEWDPHDRSGCSDGT